MIRSCQVLFLVSIVFVTLVGCKTWSPKSPSLESGNAVNLAKPASTKNPKVKACLVTAQTLHQEGHFREAALLLERARAEDPQAHDYSRQLAILYDELGISDKAESEFTIALSKSPNDPDLHNDFGFFYLQRGKLERAEGEFRQALEISPSHPQAQTNLARALFKQNRLEEAYATYENAVGPAVAHHNMGVLFSQENRDHEARLAFQEALSVDPKQDMSRKFLNGLDHLPALAANRPNVRR